MAKSNAKRAVTAVLIPLLAAATGIGLYAYPRRAVPSADRLIPREGLVACVRVTGLGITWRECVRSRFAARLSRGDIFPIDTLLKNNRRFKREWEGLDTRYWPEVFGRECIAALYGEGAALRPAVWSRVGWKSRLFHLWERTRAAACVWRDPETLSERIGVLRVTTVLDRRDRTARFSYTLIGDLGIATIGSDARFWERVSRAAGVEAPQPLPLPPAGAPVSGAFSVDIPALAPYARPLLRERSDDPLGRIAGDPRARKALGSLSLSVRRVEGEFSLGARSIGIVRVTGAVAEGEADRRSLSPDPLLRLFKKKGIAYAAAICDPGVRIDRWGQRRGIEAVEFMRGDAAELLPAEDCSFSWLGEGCSLLLYADDAGLPRLAAAIPINDPRVARERLDRYATLANGAVVSVFDAGGNRLWSTESAIGITRRVESRVPRYRLDLEGRLGRLYAPVLVLHKGFLLIATGEDILNAIEASPGQGQPPEREAGLLLMIRGAAAAGAGAAARDLLALAAPFIADTSARKTVERMQTGLGLCQWLAPLREGWVGGRREKDAVIIRCGAEFADIPPR